ncbi:hypothetical protein GVX82_03575 [Patescibacteria group bacterium]|jgi:ribosome-binding factor A|nr:hypothetical protein [Patescibacteria group bacterium]
MSIDRITRVNELLREIASEFINRESNHASLITVTRVETKRDLRYATVYISVFPEKDRSAALDFLKRKRSEMREALKQRANLKHIPTLEVALDQGEIQRQHIDGLLAEEGEGQ